MLSQDVQQQIWSFALAVRDMGLGANISFGKFVCPPPDTPRDQVHGFKHSAGEGIVTVWPVGTDQDVEVARLARHYGFKIPSWLSTFHLDHTAPVDLSGIERAYIGLRGPAQRGYSGLQVWVTPAPAVETDQLPHGDIVRQFHEAGNAYPLPARYDLCRSSPTGFECGYNGSGPHQLAVAITADLFGDADAGDPRIVGAIKDGVVAGLPADRHWLLPEARICQAIERAWEAAS